MLADHKEYAYNCTDYKGKTTFDTDQESDDKGGNPRQIQLFRRIDAAIPDTTKLNTFYYRKHKNTPVLP